MDSQNNETGVGETEKQPVDVHPEQIQRVQSTVSVALGKWNEPRINIARTVVACYGLIIMGANDAVYGAIIPYVSKNSPRKRSQKC